jgi:hypothetical protein
LLGEDAGMASSSKGRASSRKQTSAGKARVISTKRKDALPRTGSVSAGQAHSLLHKEPTASRKKTTRAVGRASAKLDEPAAMEAPQVEALAVVETEWEVEASAIIEELPVEAVTAASIAIGPPPIPEETRAPPLARTTAAHPAPARPALHHARRYLMPAISRLLSTLYRWTGVSRTK